MLLVICATDKRLFPTKEHFDGWKHKGTMSIFDEIENLIPVDSPSIFPSLDKNGKL